MGYRGNDIQTEEITRNGETILVFPDNPGNLAIGDNGKDLIQIGGDQGTHFQPFFAIVPSEARELAAYLVKLADKLEGVTDLLEIISTDNGVITLNRPLRPGESLPPIKINAPVDDKGNPPPPGINGDMIPIERVPELWTFSFLPSETERVHYVTYAEVLARMVELYPEEYQGVENRPVRTGRMPNGDPYETLAAVEVTFVHPKRRVCRAILEHGIPQSESTFRAMLFPWDITTMGYVRRDKIDAKATELHQDIQASVACAGRED